MRMYYSGRSGNIDETDIRGSLYNHQVMMRLLPYLGPYKKTVAVATLAMLVYTGSLVVFPGSSPSPLPPSLTVSWAA